MGVEPLPAAAIAELKLSPAEAAARMAFLGRSGARVASIRGGSRGGVSEDGRDAAAEAASYRFGASRRGEWLLSLPLPLAALEARGGDDSLRVEFGVGEARAELCEG